MSPTPGKGKPRGARKLKEAMTILRAMGFGPKQSNDVAGYVLLALVDLGPYDTWDAAQEPLRGITPIIDFVANKYRLRYAPNTRETIRDEAVKYFVEEGLLVKNPETGRQAVLLMNWAYRVAGSKTVGRGARPVIGPVAFKDVKVTVRGAGAAKRAVSAALDKPLAVEAAGDTLVVTLPDLAEGDVLLLE